MELGSISVKIPENSNVIIGQTHFIKSLEDLYETIITTVPSAEFGLAFAEASGPCLIRYDGNCNELEDRAVETCSNIGAGHTFVLFLRKCYPINVLNAIKCVQEVCNIFCATANPVDVIVAENNIGRGILGIIDGSSPKGIEGERERGERIAFLRKIGYKR